MSKKLVIIGASGHGKVIADIAKKNGYHEIVFWMITKLFMNVEDIQSLVEVMKWIQSTRM